MTILFDTSKEKIVPLVSLRDGVVFPGSEVVLSRPRTNPPDPCTIIRLPMALESRVTVLAKRAQSTVQDYVIEVVLEWLQEHRSGRPPVVPDED